MHARLPLSILRKSALVVEAIVYGTIGALVFAWIGVPAGLISGAILAVGIAALAGRPVPLPWSISQASSVVLGGALGATVTPEQIRSIIDAPLSVLLMMVGTLCILAGTSFYLRFVHRWDGLSALLASSPGAMPQALLLATEMHANVQAIVIVQTFRVITLMAALGPALSAFELLPDIHEPAAMAAAEPLPLAVTMIVSTVVGVAFLKLRFPGGLMLGAMAGSAVLHGTDLVHGGLPILLRDAAMILVGVMVGGRLANISPRIFFTYLAAGTGSLVVGMAIATLFMVASIMILGSPAAGAILAYVPGAVEVMMIMALAMNVDPLFVGAHQLARMLLVLTLLPVLVRVIFGRAPKQQPPIAPGPLD